MGHISTISGKRKCEALASELTETKTIPKIYVKADIF